MKNVVLILEDICYFANWLYCIIIFGTISCKMNLLWNGANIVQSTSHLIKYRFIWHSKIEKDKKLDLPFWQLNHIFIYFIVSISILLRMKCTGGWLNCWQSHFWPVTKSNEPTFELHFMHFSFPFVHSDCSISFWIHCSIASSIKYISVRPEILEQSFVAFESNERCFECAFNSWVDDIFEIIVLHLRHLICVFNFPSIFGNFLHCNDETGNLSE